KPKELQFSLSIPRILLKLALIVVILLLVIVNPKLFSPARLAELALMLISMLRRI
ncbi:hypothetical protein HKBW3S42_01249, partial [Candidatus Hakubella thermalkaliphila]